ncbi:hypothetical protein ACH5RR_012068 [Cinchona calisaya]|uniref:Uncharacterized protein n=1 Tax=Cinchona calisaya TaxID=153742 RepID=A0ABD3A6S3_9GENT
MATSDSVTVLKRSQVTPPSSTAATEMSLPLTFLDVPFLHVSTIQHLVFYEDPKLSTNHFIDNIIPKFKDSLSHALEYFLPLAGNLIVPPSSSSSMPEIRYTKGNSVTLIFAECKKIDFSYLISNQARNCSEFHHLIPELEPSFNDDSGNTVISTPVLAVQITIFPNLGMSIGISNHHAVGDGRNKFNFMKTWAALHAKLIRNDTDILLQSDHSLPFYDRTVIKDAKGLASLFWNQSDDILKRQNTYSTKPHFTSANKVRKTFVINQKHVEKLKNSVLEKQRKLGHLSSFTAICGYIWTCVVKSRDASGETVDDQELEHFSCVADCRGRLDPPLPDNYFGNCLTFCYATTKKGILVGEEGFAIAVELIGEAIHQRVVSSDALFNDAENWWKEVEKMNWERVVGVSGSPRYNYYNLDFGWGKPIKFEFASIDSTGSISLNGCRDSDSGVEVGLSLFKPNMDAFSIIFKEGLNAL